MNRTIVRAFEKLREVLPIQEYMDIPIDNVENSSFNIEISDIINNRIELEIRYTFRENGYYFHMLPPEINNLIDSFMNDYIIINITMVLPLEFPFIAPLWILTNIDTNKIREPINNYFIDKILCHNKEDVTPAYTLNKNILHFVSTIKFNGNELIY
jgi:hypothetical protein